MKLYLLVTNSGCIVLSQILNYEISLNVFPWINVSSQGRNPRWSLENFRTLNKLMCINIFRAGYYLKITFLVKLCWFSLANVIFNPFNPSGLFLSPLNLFKNQRFSDDAFSGYRKWPVPCNWLGNITFDKYVKAFLQRVYYLLSILIYTSWKRSNGRDTWRSNFWSTRLIIHILLKLCL